MNGPSVEDRFAIDDLYNEYMWALDTGDTNAFVAKFTDDADVWEDQPDGSTWKGSGKDQVREFVLKYHSDPHFPGHQHRESTRVFEADPEGRPEHWAVKSYVFATTFDVASHSAKAYWSGYYRDIVAKQDGEWKFVFRWIAPWKGEVLEGFGGRS